MRVLQFLLVLFIVNATVLACGGQRSSSGSRWVLKSQDNIPLVAPQTFHVCIPVGVTPQNDSLLNTFQPFMATIQFVFEEKVSFMELDWDYNGKGIDYAEKSQTNVVTLLLHDYNGASHFNWSPVSLVRGTVSALVRADKKLLKVIFAIATIKSSLNSVSGSKEVCDRILASKDKNKASEHSRLFANWMIFLVACLGTFCILLCGLKVCLLIYRRHSRKPQQSECAHEMEEKATSSSVPEKTNDDAQLSVVYIPQSTAQSVPQFWIPQQPIMYTPMMMQPQYIQFLPYVTPSVQQQQT